MKTAVAAALVQALAVQGIRIVQSNDDGWAELYTRSLHDALTADGHQVVLSAPAENKSGTGKMASPPRLRLPCFIHPTRGERRRRKRRRT
mgnify:CR=1 FL=1